MEFCLFHDSVEIGWSALYSIFIVALGDSLPMVLSRDPANFSSLFTDSTVCVIDCDGDELSVISNLNVMSVVNIGYFLQNSSMHVLVKSRLARQMVCQAQT